MPAYTLHNSKISLFGALVSLFCSSAVQAHGRSSFEIWLVDQSNTRDLAYGGAIHALLMAAH